MTEPGVASSDPTQLQSTAVLSSGSSTSSSSSEQWGAGQDEQSMPSFESIIRGAPVIKQTSTVYPPRGSVGGDRKEEAVWVINGRKWWTTGACDPKCACCIFVALTGRPADPSHRRHSLFIFPLTAPGVTVVRPLYVMGYDDAPHGHADVLFEGVKVSSSGILGGLGKGFEVAQSRLGPGRLHHCSRLVGHGHRAIEEILKRGAVRKAFGKCLLDLGGNSEKLAQCTISLRLAELSVVEAAVQLDRSPHHASRLPDSALQALGVTKVATPKAVQECLDFAIQIHGGGQYNP
jgi:acyl-CoA dehydrogenase